MGAPLTTDISDFRHRDLTFEGKNKSVLVSGEIGPALVVIHEIYGFTPTVARLCGWVRDAGFRVYAPILFGRADATNEERQTLGRVLGLCISREFTILAANRSSPVADWLKSMARQAHLECGGRGVGVIGMCITGGFALSMAVDPAVIAPVMGQPGLPAFDSAGLDISPADLNRVKERAAAEELHRFANLQRFVKRCRLRQQNPPATPDHSAVLCPHRSRSWLVRRNVISQRLTLMKTTYCIVGATRGTGLLIAQQLLAGEANVRVVARDPDKASRLLGRRVDVHPGDVTDARSIQDAICGVYQAIFFTVSATGGMDGRALFGSKTMIREVTYQGLVNVVDAARASGFEGRFVLPSVVGADQASFIVGMLNTIKSGLQRNLIERELYLRTSGLDYTIVRAPILTNVPAGQVNVCITRAINKLTVKSKVSRGDLARVMILASQQAVASRKTFDLVTAKGVAPS
ncbi:MAG: NAD(P)H-binding protein, partial [Verrucomicrobia bacterium]|nr:NAD(P)H-binding protein [Verrucomicrobiota bacterium]